MAQLSSIDVPASLASICCSLAMDDMGSQLRASCWLVSMAC